MGKYKNTIHTVEITDVNNLGYGVARVDSMVTFVSGAVTGDIAEIKIIKEAKSYFVARVESLATPSPYRILSDCEVSKRCGGCVYRHIDYEYEKSLKRSYVENAFRKAGIEIKVANVTNDGNINSYRNKVQYPVAEDGTIGYYANHTHEIIGCEKCLLESPVIAPISAKLASMKDKLARANLRHIYIRSADATGEVMVCFITKSDEFPSGMEIATELLNSFPNIRTVVQNINPTDGNVILGKKNKIIYGDGYIEDELCSLKFTVSPMSFYQVNRNMTELLYAKVKELAEPKNGETVVDLFCGVGTIGLSVCRGCDCSLLGIEIVPDAVKNAKHNAEINGIKNAKFVCGDANDAVPENAPVVILDPPRKGCDEKLIETLGTLSPERIVYVSCNPDTLARDVARFMQIGYRADTVYPFDLFPRTGHVENVTVLKRR